MKPALTDLVADFERATGHKLAIAYDPAGAVYASEFSIGAPPHLMKLSPDLGTCERLAESGSGRLLTVTPSGVLIQLTTDGHLMGLARDGHLLWTSANTFVGQISDIDGVLYATTTDLLAVVALG